MERLMLRLVSVFLVSATLWSAARADVVERVPPAVFAEVLEQELTDVHKLLGEVDYFSPEESTHGCVLQENFIYIDASGRTYEVIHHAYKALSDGDLDGIGTGNYYFRPDTDRIFLIQAETILPDGTVTPVPAEGILIQTPQKDQDSMIFSGRKQLRLIYPKVSLGSVTHCVVLVERESSRIPGHYVDRYSWARSWQTHLKRVVVNLPERDWSRLTMVSYGEGVPEVEEATLDGGRKRYEWVREKLPVRRSEYLDGPIIQTGPALFLSTLSGWDEFGEWYGGLVAESSEVTDEIRDVAVEWAKGAVSEDEIIHQLAFRVANDIRYVSLEFGIGGLQPQPVASVLENQFGDCKDKANFLRVLLKEHDISSYVALVNTDHAGHVEKRSADYGCFDHAILMIEKSNGEILFCDPTIKYGSAGLLYPLISDRPALIVDHEALRCRWEQIPQKSAGSRTYGMDLKLSEMGELSGWFTIEADGYYAASFSMRFEDTEKEGLKQDVEKYLKYFYDASTVIDFELQRATFDQQRFFLKVYFVRDMPGQAAASVAWPDVKWLLPKLGDEKEVTREAFIWDKDVDFRVEMSLPDSVAVSTMPESWDVMCPGFVARGSWLFKDGDLVADLSFTVSDTQVPPVTFPKLFNAVDATKHWLDKIVILGGSDRVALDEPTPVSEESLGDEFVLMTSGKGQVALVDHLYPASSKPKQRWLALEKTRVWFPKDLVTQFECETRLGWLAYEDKRYEESLAVSREVCRNYGHAVDSSLLGWAGYLEAMSLEELGQIDESLSRFRELEADSEQDDFRRGYCAYQAGRILAKSNAVESADYYLKALSYDSRNEQWMLKNSYGVLCDHLSLSEWIEYFDSLHELKPEKAKSLVVWLAELGEENVRRLFGLVRASRIYELLSGISFAEDSVGEELFEKLRGLDSDYKVYKTVRMKLEDHLQKNQYGFWSSEPDRQRTFDEYNRDIETAIADDQIEFSGRLSLWRIFSLDPEVEFSQWVWEAARVVDYLYKNGTEDVEPLRELLFGMADELPENTMGAIDLHFLHAEALKREGHVDQALDIYSMLAESQLDSQWWEALYSRWASLLLSSGDVENAMEVYSTVRELIEDDKDFVSIAIQGVYTLLEQGEFDKASAWIIDLHNQCQALELENDWVAHLETWIDLDKAGTLDTFWAFQGQWTSQWASVWSVMDLPAAKASPADAVYDGQELGEQLGTAVAQKEYEAVSTILAKMTMAAKWHPDRCWGLQSIISYLVQHFPKAEELLYQQVILMNCEEFLSEENEKYSSRSTALDALLKIPRYDELIVLAEKYFNDPLTDEAKAMYCRYGAMGLINLGQPGGVWLARMEEQLKNPEQRNDPYAVNIVSRLYRLEGRMSDEYDLLKEFLTSKTNNREEIYTVLETRFKQLQDLVDGNQQLTIALEEWVENYKPDWVGLFSVPDLGQSDVADVTSKASEIQERIGSASYKDAVYLLHVALDERLSSMARENAFYNFLIKSMGPIWSTSSNLAMLDAVIQDDRFSDSIRINCSWFAAHMAFSVYKSGYIDTKFIPHLKMLGELESVNGNEVLLADYCRKDPFSATDLSGWMNSAIDALQPFDWQAVLLLNQSFSELCRLGALDLAEKHIATAKTFRFSTGSNSSGFALQLQWRQELERVKELMPIHQVLQSFFEKKLNPSCERPDYHQVAFRHDVSLQDGRSATHALLQYRLYDHSSLGFWSQLNEFELSNGNICVDQSNIGSLLDQVLGTCQTDSQYSQAVELCSWLFDTDNPVYREIFYSYTEILLRRPELKKTHQTLLWIKYRQLIREGEYARVLVDVKSERSLSSQQLHAFMMSVLLIADDIEALSDYLNTASPDLLLEDTQLANTLYAYKLCGRNAEYELFAEKGQEVLREFMASAVQTGEHYPVYQALELIEQLPWSASYESWEHLVENVARQDVVAYMQMNLAHLREDWAALEIASQALTKYRPLVYDNYFFLGKACVKQQKYAEGVKAFELFLKYCKDMKEYREGQELYELARSKIK